MSSLLRERERERETGPASVVYHPHSFQFLYIMLSGERVGVVTQLYLSRGSGPAAKRLDFLLRDNK